MSAHSRKLAAVPASMAVCCLLLPGSAAAGHKLQPVKAAATISACEADTLTVRAQIKPLGRRQGRQVPKRLKRKLRKAALMMSVEATPLSGRPQRTEELKLGRGFRARRVVRFADLPADNYSGVLRYRWVRGKKTVFSDLVRTSKGRVAGRRGRAYCSLRVGETPRDTTPPIVLPLPYDNAWKRGPLDVQFYAVDDLSGVSGVFWRLNQGRFNRGRRLRIASEGVHTLQYLARDAAGNSTPLRSIQLRVDTNPPAAPAVTAPAGATTDATPTISWTASSDSGSGVRGYFVLVRNSSNAIVFGQPVGAAGPLTVGVTETLAPGQYTAEVIAIDGAGANPFTATGRSSFAVTG